MNSLSIRRMEQDLINYLNSVPLPMECKRLALEEILGQVRKQCEMEIAEETQAEIQAGINKEEESE